MAKRPKEFDELSAIIQGPATPENWEEMLRITAKMKIGSIFTAGGVRWTVDDRWYGGEKIYKY